MMKNISGIKYVTFPEVGKVMKYFVLVVTLVVALVGFFFLVDMCITEAMQLIYGT